MKDMDNVKNFILNLLYYGGVIPSLPSGFCYDSLDKNHCKAICDEIIYRQFNFVKNKLDSHLEYIDVYHYYNNNPNIVKIKSKKGGVLKRTVEELAKYIAWFCAENNIIWDDSNQSVYAIDEAKQTILGNAIFEAGCFLNNKPASFSQAAAQAITQTAAQSQAASTKQPGQPPQNNYKSSGPQSGNIINIIGAPNQKINLSGTVYAIIADKTGKNVPNAFVKPLDSKYQIGNANKICFGSGNGYTDCTCFLSTLTDAQNFLARCQADFSHYTNVRIEKSAADKNGYFQVRTVYGDCFIKAKKMNEELLTEPVQPKKDLIGDIDIYDEWFKRSIS